MAHNPYGIQQLVKSHCLRLFSADLLQAAVRQFRANLSPTQAADLLKHSSNNLDATTILAFTAEVDKVSANRRSRCVSSRLFGILQSVQEFSSIADTLVSSHPEIAALVLGSLKLTILVLHAFMFITTLLTYLRLLIISYPSSTNYRKSSSGSVVVAPDIQSINSSSPILYGFKRLCVHFSRQLLTSARRPFNLSISQVYSSFTY
jgi:hypothetical protein